MKDPGRERGISPPFLKHFKKICAPLVGDPTAVIWLQHSDGDHAFDSFTQVTRPVITKMGEPIIPTDVLEVDPEAVIYVEGLTFLCDSFKTLPRATVEFSND